jgi:hypothetical protein
VEDTRGGHFQKPALLLQESSEAAEQKDDSFGDECRLLRALAAILKSNKGVEHLQKPCRLADGGIGGVGGRSLIERQLAEAVRESRQHPADTSEAVLGELLTTRLWW